MNTTHEGIRRMIDHNGTSYTAEVYWDNRDPANEGWAYRVYETENREGEESGPIERDDYIESPWEYIERRWPGFRT
jgi:hypothetical protein